MKPNHFHDINSNPRALLKPVFLKKSINTQILQNLSPNEVLSYDGAILCIDCGADSSLNRYSSSTKAKFSLCGQCAENREYRFYLIETIKGDISKGLNPQQLQNLNFDEFYHGLSLNNEIDFQYNPFDYQESYKLAFYQIVNEFLESNY